VDVLFPNIILFQFLAVVYNAFITVEKEKVRKLQVHRMHASLLAFRLLTDEEVMSSDGLISNLSFI